LEQELYAVVKVPHGTKYQYKVKTQHGIETFNTLKNATIYAERAKKVKA